MDHSWCTSALSSTVSSSRAVASASAGAWLAPIVPSPVQVQAGDLFQGGLGGGVQLVEAPDGQGV